MLFGASVAFAYAVLQLLHEVCGLFLALTLVTVVRGLLIAVGGRQSAPKPTSKNLNVTGQPREPQLQTVAAS